MAFHCMHHPDHNSAYCCWDGFTQSRQQTEGPQHGPNAQGVGDVWSPPNNNDCRQNQGQPPEGQPPA